MTKARRQKLVWNIFIGLVALGIGARVLLLLMVALGVYCLYIVFK